VKNLLLTVSLLFPLCSMASVVSHYRFEEGSAGTSASTIVDSVGTFNGTAVGAPVYSADVGTSYIDSIGAANNTSLAFSGASSIDFSNTFIFHTPGNSTLEFSIKFNNPAHTAIFWTRPDNTDANRYNIYTDPVNNIGFDYRAPGGSLHASSNPAATLTPDEWANIVIRRNGNVYETFLNGVLQASVTDSSPDLPTSVGWQISGRDGFRLDGLLDEVRMSDSALTESQFLMSIPVPAPSALLIFVLGVVMVRLSVRRP
jgi:hypothetical protein